MLTENPIERLRARTAWFQELALEAKDDEVAQSLLQLAAETESLIRAVMGGPPPQDEG